MKSIIFVSIFIIAFASTGNTQRIFSMQQLFDLKQMLVKNGLGAFVQQLGDAQLQQFGQHLRDFFNGIRAASPEELPFVLHDDIPALLTGLIEAMNGYDQAFTKAGSPYAAKVRQVGAILQALTNIIRNTSAPLVQGKQRQGASLYTSQTSQFSTMLSAGVTQLPPQLIPNVMQAIGDYFNDHFHAFMWALDMQLTYLPATAWALRQAVVRIEGDIAQTFPYMVQIFKSRA